MWKPPEYSEYPAALLVPVSDSVGDRRAHWKFLNRVSKQSTKLIKKTYNHSLVCSRVATRALTLLNGIHKYFVHHAMDINIYCYKLVISTMVCNDLHWAFIRKKDNIHQGVQLVVQRKRFLGCAAPHSLSPLINGASR